MQGENAGIINPAKIPIEYMVPVQCHDLICLVQQNEEALHVVKGKGVNN